MSQASQSLEKEPAADHKVAAALPETAANKSALRAQRRLYEAVLTTTPDLAYVFDLNYRFIYANRGLLKMWGKTWEEAIGKTCLELGYEPWHAAMHAREIDQVVETRQPIRGEVPFTGTFGRRVYDYIFTPVFDDEGAVVAVAGTTRDITDNHKTEEALRKSEAQYRALFEAMDEGYWLADVIFDEWDHPVDILFVEVNPASRRMIGRELVGHRVSEIGSYEPYWFETFGRVARTGCSERQTQYSAAEDRWYEFYVYKPEPQNPASVRIATIYRDVTARKRGEKAQREEEERKVFLLKLSDALRNLADPEETLLVASRLLGEQLGANRVGYAEDQGDGQHVAVRRHYAHEVPSIEGTFRYQDFGELTEEFNAGRTVVYHDISQQTNLPASAKDAHLRLQVGATLDKPIYKGGRLLAVLFVHYREAHTFTEQELALVEETAERTWAAVERAKAEAIIAQDLRDTSLLRELGARLLAESDEQSLYEEILAAAITLAHSDAGTVQILDETTQELVIIATRGFSDGLTRHFRRLDAKSFTSCGRALAANQRIFLHFDVPADEDPDGSLRMHVDDGYRSAQSTPLVTRTGKSIGMVSTHWHQRHRPSERELRFLDLLARQAADLIEQRQSHRALRLSEARLASELADARELQKVSLHLLQEDNIDRLYRQILDAAVALAKSDAGSLQMMDAQTHELVLLAWKGFHADSAKFWERIGMECLSTCSIALQRGERIVVEDCEASELSLGEENLKHYRLCQLRAIQSTPLISRSGQLVGMISTHWRDPHQVTEHELRALDVVARQAADLIERKLAEDALASAARADAFRVQITDALRLLSDPAEMQKAVLDLTGKYLQASRVLYSEIGPDEDFTVITENYLDGVAPLVGELRLRDFGNALTKELRAGRTVVERDMARVESLSATQRAAYASVNVAAHVGVPLMKDGKLVATFAVHQKEPRDWQKEEVALIGEMGERIRAALERSRAEKALRHSEEQVRLIVENVRDYGIIAADLGRRIINWNPGAEQIFGYSREEAIGQSLDMIFTPEDRTADVCGEEADTALKEGRASDERWHLRKNGSRFWVSGVMMAMRDGDGHAVGFVKVLRDHTEARRSAEALAKSHAEAEAANRAKDHFLAVLSHELRTPLTPVLLIAADMAGNESLSPSARHALAMIHRNVELESKLIDDLLDVTRITRGKVEITRQSIDLHDTLVAAVRICEADIKEKNQSLKLDLRARHHQVSGDPNRLQQVFWNLLKNACKFTPAQGKISIASWDEPQAIHVSISDDGIGLRPELLEKIFNPFEQGDVAETREFGGLGLGLAIAKATMEAHGGLLGAASEGPGRGSVFTVSLPLE